MRGPSVGGQGSPYEVRCPRCNVSFPVETRRCIHCGGATAASGAVVGIGTQAGPIGPAEVGAPATRSPAPVPVGGSDQSDELAAPPQGLAATLLRSFGSLFWIIALVAFSFARSCREG